MIERIYSWNIRCTPWTIQPIRSMVITVVATSRKEAELIVLEKAHKFFDQDMMYTWSEPMEGYRQK